MPGPPIPAQSIRYVIRGTGPGNEIWQTGWWGFVTPAFTTQADLQADVTQVFPLVATWWNAIKGFIYPTYALTELREYYYSGGSDTAEFAAAHVYTPVVGTQAGNGSPIDTCLVQSLRTDFVGQSNRGRMYAPHHGLILASGLIQAATATTYCNATAALLSGTTSAAVVMSRVTSDQTPITSVQVDLKPDVQRRRENRLAGGTPATAAVT